MRNGETIKAAQGRWRGILKHFGIGDEFLRNQHGPCPLCGGNDRYRWDDKDGSGSYYCSGCGPGTGMQLAMAITGKDFREVADEIDRIVGVIPEQSESKQSDESVLHRLKQIARQVHPAEGINPVSRYLQSRGLRVTDAIRYHPRMRYYEGGEVKGVFPAMLCVFWSPDMEARTYHVTYLNHDGSKADVASPRKVLPATGPLKGGAIRLHEPSDVVGIAEGVETALAATQSTGIPCWAAYSATLLESFQPPENKRVVVFGDNDASFTGQKSAYALAFRLKREGLDVDVRIPDRVDSDWADEVAA